jgi:DNA ligase 1
LGSLLKIKTFYDAEAIVVGHAPGKGRNKGIMGALKCKMESGKVCPSLAFFGVYSLLNFLLCSQLFNVGSGLTDKIRKNPPKIGIIITVPGTNAGWCAQVSFRRQPTVCHAAESKPNFPLTIRFPSFIGIAIDKDAPKDAETPEHCKTGRTSS